ncbi:hypothetical protein [Jiangella mangrovi]|uniref:Uncharacterized protein n=1 Tax=Jiangella mangrovi TaxID=1524084 RepID=A0A7W9LQ22_9ACTN|nr:hypothetical protein [Jiangella mangrovi]MBB5791802.1 hypothetical protein [Jiangella mangrovi]
MTHEQTHRQYPTSGGDQPGYRASPSGVLDGVRLRSRTWPAVPPPDAVVTQRTV